METELRLAELDVAEYVEKYNTVIAESSYKYESKITTRNILVWLRGLVESIDDDLPEVDERDTAGKIAIGEILDQRDDAIRVMARSIPYTCPPDRVATLAAWEADGGTADVIFTDLDGLVEMEPGESCGKPDVRLVFRFTDWDEVADYVSRPRSGSVYVD